MDDIVSFQQWCHELHHLIEITEHELEPYSFFNLIEDILQIDAN